ncbi:dTDP-4-dehydrorhamnose reductase [Ulvibacter sp. MAR_2010_11]|uniref:dTDP-4-dehydrorhamnose reductase n=1 Tax=Ulvibacter sp. MAR_2010_11 TaxID=1250229 RepID=UPI000C2C0810|nr:dTDP-4-dehydrorhamnose reductase [Ulvibacter sp. MAR_2010_11]PKA82920.1 dTDP-4-dehydrorhamnose reductase [Ulvibacter sp. MAR_2010_11]
MKKVLVTGANGQLGRCIKDNASEFPDLSFVFTSKRELDIENHAQVRDFFQNNKIDYCINTAAYTNVEKAESEQGKAFSLNTEAVKNLALCCKQHNVILLHISTDYVFDGKKRTPYTEEDVPNPINVYGASKLKGEQYIQEICEMHYIVRSSWLYSQYGHNFFKTILKYAEEGKSLSITTEQTGTPTNANDLAQFLLGIIDAEEKAYGLYHFSNEGETTWHGFAEAVFKCNPQFDASKLVKTGHYPTFAQRPKYSVLNCYKAQKIISFKTRNWKDSFIALLKIT